MREAANRHPVLAPAKDQKYTPIASANAGVYKRAVMVQIHDTRVTLATMGRIADIDIRAMDISCPDIESLREMAATIARDGVKSFVLQAGSTHTSSRPDCLPSFRPTLGCCCCENLGVYCPLIFMSIFAAVEDDGSEGRREVPALPAGKQG